MNEKLEMLIEKARTHHMSEGEREAQRRSFAFGNAKIANLNVTWEMIVKADGRIKAELQCSGTE